MKKNETVTLDVSDLNNLGYGVAHLGGMTVFVSGAVCGDRVEAKILRVEKTWAAAKTEKILSPSPVRCDGGCPARGCGGCAYREITYEEECRRKQNYVDFCFRKAGVAAEVLPVLTGSETDGYRNKAQYAVAAGKDGALTAGFFAPKSHRVVPAVRCPLQPPVFGDIVQAVLDFCASHGVTAYDEETGKGLLRHIYLRRSETEREVLVTLVVNGDRIPGEAALAPALVAACPEVSGVLLNENREKTNVVLGARYRTLWGKSALTDRIGNVRLSVAPDAFFQVNRSAAELLYAKAKELANLTGNELLWDLYCGAGSIGLYMADRCREVVGVEIVQSAVENAAENAKENGIRHARFVTGDAGSPQTLLANAYDEKHRRPDVVVLDPPRKGSTEELLAYLADEVMVPTIVYISCGPDTLARDAAVLVSHGYAMSPVQPVNLFPRTGHVETVVLMSRDKE